MLEAEWLEVHKGRDLLQVTQKPVWCLTQIPPLPGTALESNLSSWEIFYCATELFLKSHSWFFFIMTQ